MKTLNVSDIENHFAQLEHEIQTIAAKHNSLVLSLGMVWTYLQQSSDDMKVKELCARRLSELDTLIHGVEQHRP